MKGYIPPAHLRGQLRPHQQAGFWNHNPWSRTYYVNSAHTNAGTAAGGRSGLDPDVPLSNIVDAVAAIANGSYEDAVIVVGPEHTETISSQLDLAVQGTMILGLGQGDRRPTFTFTSAAAVGLKASVSGVRLSNIRLVAGVDSLPAAVSVEAADFVGEELDIEHDATYQMLVGIIMLAAAHNSRLTGIRARQAAAGAASCLSIAGAADSVVIQDCDLIGDYSAGCISNTVGAATNLLISHNYLESTHANDVCIDLIGTATGFIAHNKCRIATDVQTTWIDTFDGQLFENYGVNNDNETGVLIGTPSA